MSERMVAIAGRVFVALLFAAGLALRLEGHGSSLWVDEFGTVWVIDGPLRDIGIRSAQAQGQTPLYYVVAWAAVSVFGESEQALRAVSIVAAAAATLLVGFGAGRLGGVQGGVTAALLFWFAPSFVATSTSVRPYALAYLFAAMGVLGFVRACTSPRRGGRAMFIVGVAGVWWTHFLLAPVAVGLGLAWLVVPALRAAYRPRDLVRDVALIGLLVLPTVPQLLNLTSRRSDLAWAGLSSWAVLSPLVPLGVVALVGLAFIRGRRRWSPVQQGLAVALLASIAVHVGTLALATALGPPLMVSRFLMVALVPASVLAGALLAAAPTPLIVIACVGFLAVSAKDLRQRHRVYGTFSGAGYQHWREAVDMLQRDVKDDPSVVVLYRSGFVEDDVAPFGTGAPHTRSPLRSPGRSTPRFTTMVLPFRWSNPALHEYLEREVAPRLASARVFYFIGPPFAEQATGEYADSLRRWVDARWPGVFRVEPVGSAQAMVLLRFSASSASP